MLPQQPAPPHFGFIRCHCEQNFKEFLDLLTNLIASQITICASAPCLWMFPSHVYLSRSVRVIHRQPYFGEENEHYPSDPLPTQSWSSGSVSSLQHIFAKKQTRASAESSGQTNSDFIAFWTHPECKSSHQAKLRGCFPIPTNNT